MLFCFDCSNNVHFFDKGFAVFEYGDIRESLYRFKYAGRAEYADFYAKITMQYLGETLQRLEADALIPVPLHWRREQKRNYNQACEYAQKLSEYLHVPVCSDYIRRISGTRPLKELSRMERQNNLKRAFIITRNDVKLNTIIIIDDIYTTGATIDAVSRAFRNAGVNKIYFLTLAIGNGL